MISKKALKKAFHTLSIEDEKTKKLLSLEIEKNRKLKQDSEILEKIKTIIYTSDGENDTETMNKICKELDK